MTWGKCGFWKKLFTLRLVQHKHIQNCVYILVGCCILMFTAVLNLKSSFQTIMRRVTIPHTWEMGRSIIFGVIMWDLSLLSTYSDEMLYERIPLKWFTLLMPVYIRYKQPIFQPALKLLLVDLCNVWIPVYVLVALMCVWSDCMHVFVKNKGDSLTADNDYNCSKWLWFRSHICFEDVQLWEEDAGKESVGISLNFSTTRVLCQIPFKKKDIKNQQKEIRIGNCKPHIRSYSTDSWDRYICH